MSQLLKSELSLAVLAEQMRSSRGGGARKAAHRVRHVMLGAAAMLTTGLFLAQPAMAADAGDQAKCDPYKDYSCLDSYLGDNVTDRIWNYYKLEWGEAGAPTDPNAQPSRRDGWPATPMLSMTIAVMR